MDAIREQLEHVEKVSSYYHLKETQKLDELYKETSMTLARLVSQGLKNEENASEELDDYINLLSMALPTEFFTHDEELFFLKATSEEIAIHMTRKIVMNQFTK